MGEILPIKERTKTPFLFNARSFTDFFVILRKGPPSQLVWA